MSKPVQTAAETQLVLHVEGLKSTPPPQLVYPNNQNVETTPLVYLACPYSKGDPCINTANATTVARLLERATGCVVINPLSSHWEHTHSPLHYEDWLFRDFRMILACDAVVRLHGESSGADRECERARHHGKPVLPLKPGLVASTCAALRRLHALKRPTPVDVTPRRSTPADDFNAFLDIADELVAFLSRQNSTPHTPGRPLDN